MSDHLTEDQLCRAIAGQSTIDELRHTAGCDRCRTQIERSRAVFGMFRGVMTVWASRAARQSGHAAGLRGRAARTWGTAVGAASLVMLLAGAAWQVLPAREGAPARREPPRALTTDTHRGGIEATEFFPLTYSSVPVTEGRLVRIEVPGSALAAFGLDPADASSSRHGVVLADVIVGEDGLARGVRFLRAPRGARAQKENVP